MLSGVPAFTLRTTVNVTGKRGTFGGLVIDATNAGFVQLIVPVPPTAGVAQVQPGTELMDWNVVFAGIGIVSDEFSVRFGQGLESVTL